MLSESEVRVLGSLIEKEITTPEYYPLTLNALIAACNQKSNREPVTELDSDTIVAALDSLRSKHLVWHLSGGGRVQKYDHSLRTAWSLSPPELAVLCVLMLRGPQTAAEIRARSERLHAFDSVQRVQEVLQALAQRDGGPLVKILPRQVGQKESRAAHLLSGEPAAPELPSETPRPVVLEHAGRVGELEKQVAKLREDLDELRALFADLRKRFEQPQA